MAERARYSFRDLEAKYREPGELMPPDVNELIYEAARRCGGEKLVERLQHMERNRLFGKVYYYSPDREYPIPLFTIVVRRGVMFEGTRSDMESNGIITELSLRNERVFWGKPRGGTKNEVRKKEKR